MLSVEGDYGTIIDDYAANIALMHKKRLAPPSRQEWGDITDGVVFNTAPYLGQGSEFGFVFDFETLDTKAPIIGVTFYYGICYAQVSYRYQNTHRVRVYIAAHKGQVLKHYPELNHLSSKSNLAFLEAFMQAKPFDVLFFGKPQIRAGENAGLLMYNQNGELIYSSSSPIMQFPPDLPANADKYRAFVVCKSFFPLQAYLDSSAQPIAYYIHRKSATPLLFIGTKEHGGGEAATILSRINPKYMRSVAADTAKKIANGKPNQMILAAY